MNALAADACRSPLQRRLLGALYPLPEVPAVAASNHAEIQDLLAAPLHQAAVLVPLVEREHGVQVLLTRRHAGLRTHAGQVSFPGGRVEATDRGPVEAALREAHEEVGLAPSQALPLGYLDPLVTISAFHVWPVVAMVTAGFQARIDEREVSEAFEVPLDFLLDPGNCHAVEMPYQGRVRRWHEFHYRTHRIWGATAAMLVNLRLRMQAPRGRE